MFISASDSSNTIDFLGIQISISSFLLIAGGIALLVFLGLLVILLLMYLRKKMAIKGYLGFDKKSYQVEDEILEIEGEILQIQKKLYLNKQIKKTKKVFS
ncbi:hypothetical protein [Spiroplasma platyhelix]|uniref:Uncharacterized protein n=1 Tax=Spiroplasma platyhelix PALS-1 TaxID=1276218 RepID=A0A846UE47_9MOLU|nr:hypothetical protein [Spiroplasma platyhelix]MBE4704386.1 hypothetical protein [Spiroplasma platyhelix PALS-1]NKE38758.1 hypothetical protein [Spiroplasma platyhelix PALS-1]UJB28969.1 hypothetical protein SPLAT_v1c02040 [Spiroplasma platyhelix PALS-1]